MGTLLHYWWECKLVQLLWKTVWRFLKKLKIELPYNPEIVLVGVYPKDTGMLIHRGTLFPYTTLFRSLARMWRNGNPLALLVGMQTVAATLENTVEVPQKVKNRTTL